MPVDTVKVEIITRDFGRMLEDFAEIDPSVEFKDIVRGVAVRVMGGSVRRTDAADIDKIKAQHQRQEATSLDGKRYRLDWHYPDELWRRIENHRVITLNNKIGARGLAKKSWYQLGQKLGGPIDAPGYVQNARFKQTFDYPEDVSFTETTSGGAFAIRVINTSPIVQKAHGEQALVYSMNGETRYFYALLDRHAFLNAERRASRYPGVYVSPNPDPVPLQVAQVPDGMFGG